MRLTFPSVKATYPHTLVVEPRIQGMSANKQTSIERVYGLKRNAITREIEFNTNVADSLIVAKFLLARLRDNKSFNYTYPNDRERSYKCHEWSRSQPYCNDVTIKAKFQEFFEVTQ
jgi:hypothetical protein